MGAIEAEVRKKQRGCEEGEEVGKKQGGCEEAEEIPNVLIRW